MAARHDMIGDCGLEFERIFYNTSTEPFPTVHKCDCGKRGCKAKITFAAPRRHAYLPDVVYYENSNGQLFVPTDPTDPAPHGQWTKKATGLYNEIQDLERRVNNQEKSKASAFREISHQQALAKQRANRDILMSGEYVPEMELTASGEMIETGRLRRLPSFHEMSDAMKDFARNAMEESNRAMVRETREIDPGMYFRSLHFDQRRK